MTRRVFVNRVCWVSVHSALNQFSFASDDCAKLSLFLKAILA